MDPPLATVVSSVAAVAAAAGAGALLAAAVNNKKNPVFLLPEPLTPQSVSKILLPLTVRLIKRIPNNGYNSSRRILRISIWMVTWA